MRQDSTITLTPNTSFDRFGQPRKELDARGIPLFGTDLRDLIIRSVDRTQKFIAQELPNWLVLSHKQFVSLLDYTQPMFDPLTMRPIETSADTSTVGRMFVTPLNVMEVVVDEDVDPVPIIGGDELGNDWDETDG